MIAMRKGCRHLSWGFLLTVFFCGTAFSQVDLSVIPREVHTNGEVTVTIEIPNPEGEVEIRLLAQRIDSNNDGVIDQDFGIAFPVGRAMIVKDLGKSLPYAKDRNPQLRRIQYRLLSPAASGEYLVEVKIRGEHIEKGVQKPLLVYSRRVEDRDNEASVLNRWSGEVPKVVMAELYRSLRGDSQDRVEQSLLWMVNAKGERIQLTNDGLATDPQWAPAGKNASWLAYSFADSQDATFDIWILNTENPSDRRRITGSAEDDLSPIWSPDGNKIAFVRGDTVFVSYIDRKHDAEAIVRQDGVQQILSWDARFQSLVYLRVFSKERVKQIWAVNVESKKTKALTYNPLWGLVKSVTASSNRNRLLFEWKARTSKEVDIYSLDFPGLVSVNLTENFRRVRCIKPSLSADGKQVAFVVMPID